jgi:hypothetical protein
MIFLRKAGVVFVLVGIALPLIAFLFAGSETDPGLLGQMKTSVLVLLDGKGTEADCFRRSRGTILPDGRDAEDECILTWPEDSRPARNPIVLPYRYVLATGIVLLFVGIGTVILARAA